MNLTGTVQTDIATFNSTLARYVAETGKSTDEVLDKKGRDLGIRLFKGFLDRKWGGPGKSPRLATAELQKRTAAGEGTRVRASLLARYNRERASTNFFARSIGQQRRRFSGTLDQHTRLTEQRDANRKQRAGLWRSIVGKEVGLRQSGIGVLAASFLWYRRANSQARGTYITKNRTGKPLGSVQRGPDFLRIIGFAPGMERTSERYGIVRRAITESNTDTETYLLRKEVERYRRAFAGISKGLAA